MASADSLINCVESSPDKAFILEVYRGCNYITKFIATGFTKCGCSPRGIKISENLGNPFNPISTIHYDLSAQTQVRLTIFDVLGGTVRTLVE